MTSIDAKHFVKDYVSPIIYAIVTGVLLYTVAFNYSFNEQMNNRKPEMVGEVQQMLDAQKMEIERDRLELLRDLDRRLANIEGLLQEMRNNG